jgi:hypothetical protein
VELLLVVVIIKFILLHLMELFVFQMLVTSYNNVDYLVVAGGGGGANSNHGGGQVQVVLENQKILQVLGQQVL